MGRFVLRKRVDEESGAVIRADGSPIRRAMGNLREVLRQRLGNDDPDPDMLHEVAALLDEVAQKIERLKR